MNATDPEVYRLCVYALRESTIDIDIVATGAQVKLHVLHKKSIFLFSLGGCGL